MSPQVKGSISFWRIFEVYGTTAASRTWDHNTVAIRPLQYSCALHQGIQKASAVVYRASHRFCFVTALGQRLLEIVALQVYPSVYACSSLATFYRSQF